MPDKTLKFDRPPGKTILPQPPDKAMQLRDPVHVCFNRQELNDILRVYGRMVASADWRDYAIDMLADRAVFSIFRKATEHALYSIEKKPKRANKQGAYSVIAPTGQILKRGHDLKKVLNVFEKKPKLIVY